MSLSDLRSSARGALPIAMFMLLALSCDRQYQTRLSGQVRVGPAGARARVIPLVGQLHAAETDAYGKFDVTYGGLNRSPYGMTVLVLVPSLRPVLLHPSTDFALHEKDDTWIGDVNVDIDSARHSAPLPLACAGGTCTAELSNDTRSCATFVIALAESRVIAVFPRESRVDGGRALTFESASIAWPPLATREVVVVTDCGGAAADYASDVTRIP
jgi:hypothetical protein